MSIQERPTPLSEAVIAAARTAGLRRLPDINRPDHEGIAYLSYTMRDGVRQSAATAFLKPVRGRANLTVMTGTRVQRIVFAGRRAVGIEVVGPHGGQRLDARREIILSAGALESPKLLQLSGIGDSDHLQGLGIPVVAHRPAVGGNLREHLLYMVQWSLRDWRSGSENR
ncbi:MAG TPA: GMC family oxidoreductase N-terminal domain-containing protein [Ramlibacter sp.]|nr:GMC family oxidoreductase N-terminal domain-containing protein [Ramlibacter sp.]